MTLINAATLSASGSASLMRATPTARVSDQIKDPSGSKSDALAASGAKATLIQISGSASAASDLLDNANKYVRSNSLTSTAIYGANGRTGANAYVNLKKYNDFVFDTAADQMVAQGKAQGLTIDKAQAVQSIRQSNYAVSSVEEDNEVRTKTLNYTGENYTVVSDFTFLTDSDRDAFTDQLIAEKKSGGDGSATYRAAADLASKRHDDDSAQKSARAMQTYAELAAQPRYTGPLGKAIYLPGIDNSIISKNDIGKAIITDMATAGTLTADTIASAAPTSDTTSTSSDTTDATPSADGSAADVKQADGSDAAQAVKPDTSASSASVSAITGQTT